MKSYKVYQIDSFTRTKFRGNPAGVVPNADGLSTAQMQQIADALSTHIGAKGVGVVIEARHFCMQMRGVQKANATTTTSALRGLFLKDEKTRKEFFALINAAKQVRF